MNGLDGSREVTSTAHSPRGNIAYFINGYPAISHVFIRREIQALERQGFDVLRIALRGWEGDLVDEVDKQERERTRYVLREGSLSLIGAVLRVVFVSPVAFASSLALAFKMGRKALRPLPYHLIYLVEACQVLCWLKKQAVTHVHAHFGTNSAEVVMLARALGGPPYSFTVHGPLEFDSPKQLGLTEKIRRAAFVVAITSYTRSQLCRVSRSDDWEKIRVVRCGLPNDLFELPNVAIPEKPRLVCIGRLVEQKGQALLIEAAARLAEMGITFELAIVGEGPMRKSLEALIRRHALKGSVELLGAVPSEQLLSEIRAARGLILPSFAEGLPMVIMEAMAMRRPVVSTYIAGIPELVKEGVTGLLIPAGSVEAIVEGMRRILSASVGELQAMGDAGYERVRMLHAADTEAAKLASLIRASVASRDAVADLGNH